MTCIRQDAYGDISAATDSGLNRFDEAADRFVGAGLTGVSILNIHFDRDLNLWADCWILAPAAATTTLWPCTTRRCRRPASPVST
ncbi:hypothetical protein ACHZ98_14760 [Streptomyces sp. MAR4 CNY-716]